MSYKFSFYNNVVEENGNTYAHNGLSGALVHLTDNRLIEKVHQSGRIQVEDYGQNILEMLSQGMFIVPVDLDELSFLESKYHISRMNDSPHLTVLPTLDCNMRCDYCYEEPSRGTITPATMADIQRFAAKLMKNNPGRPLQVDWYGGEPLLELDSIRRLSERLISSAREQNVDYNSKVISNGVLLSKPIAEELKDLGVTKCQVTLDGTKHHHDRRRVLKTGGSSFNIIIDNVLQASEVIPISLRINVDKRNASCLSELIEQLSKKELFSPQRSVRPYIAPAAPYSEYCSHQQRHWLTPAQFLHATHEFMQSLSRYVVTKGHSLYSYPRNRDYCCGGVSLNSYIINPRGNLYKCALNSYDDSKCVGNVAQVEEIFSILSPRTCKWLSYSPFDIDECRECKYLPLCLGGCPQTRMVNNKDIIGYNCSTFKENFEQSIKLHTANTIAA